MRAMLLQRPASPLEATDGDDRPPGEGEVALEVKACGVCRTDLQICDGDIPLRKQPVVPGHQIVGTVVAAGAGVVALRVGDRVGVGWLASTDGTCAHCRAGRENLCEAARFTGWDTDGGYATRAIVRADFAFRIPDGFADLDAAPLLCGGVIGYRSLKRSGIQRGGKLGLYGFGASASLAIQVARAWKCRIFVCTRCREEQQRALGLGAEWAGTYDDKPPVALDAAVTFAPSGDVVIAALKAIDRGGTVAINAIHLDRIPQFDYGDLWLERNLVSVANYTREDAREFLGLAASLPIRTTFDTYPLADANRALQNLRAGKIRGAAVLSTQL